MSISFYYIDVILLVTFYDFVCVLPNTQITFYIPLCYTLCMHHSLFWTKYFITLNDLDAILISSKLWFVKHVPKINGDIPSIDEATSDHQRLLDRYFIADFIAFFSISYSSIHQCLYYWFVCILFLPTLISM